jgi:hypothetical protein
MKERVGSPKSQLLSWPPRVVALLLLLLLTVAPMSGATPTPAASPPEGSAPPPQVELRPSAVQPGYVWLITTVDPQRYTGYGTSLALGGQDRPRIAYKYALAGDLRYAAFDGARWVTTTVDAFGPTGGQPSLVLDGQERPRIAYRNSGSMDLLYAWTGPDIDGGPWVTTTVDTPGDCGIDPSLELDGAGDPRISYNCNSCLLYAHDEGSGWQIETVACGAGWYGWNSSLALDTQERPRISYLAGWPISDLMYAWYDGAQWQHETIDSQGSVGLYTSLALDSQDYPHISYYDSSAYALKYARHDGMAWHFEVVDAGHVGQEGIGKYTSLVLDAADRPHISYFDDAHNELRYAYFDGTRWLTETVDTGDYLTGAYTSLALDAQGRPHISYRGNDCLRYTRLIELPYAVFLPEVKR